MFYFKERKGKMANIVLCLACDNVIRKTLESRPVEAICSLGKYISKNDRRRFPPIYDFEEDKYINRGSACLSYKDKKGFRSLVKVLPY